MTPDGQTEEVVMPTIRAPKSGVKVKGVKRRPGGRTLGIGAADSLEIVRQVRAGFPFSRLARFQKSTELPWETVARFVAIPQRTMTRRQTQGKLHPDESDRVWRASTIFDLAVDLFEGDVAAARHWLLAPQTGLGGEI